MGKSASIIWLTAVVVLNGVITYVAIVFSMLNGTAFARSVTAIFVSINILGALAAIYFARKRRGGIAIGVVGAVLPVSFATLIGAAHFPTLLFGQVAAKPEHRWNEVVLLSTGEQILAKRWEKRKLVREPGHEPGMLFDESRIEVALPGSGTLTWQTSLSPWLLDKSRDGTWYLVAKTMTEKSSKEYGIDVPIGGMRSPEFVAYKLVGGTWQRIVGSDLPIEFVGPNLLISSSIAFNPTKSFHIGPKGDILMYVDGKMKAVPPVEPIVEGGLVDLEWKARLNHPSHRDQEKLFELSREYFDDGTRYIGYECKPQSTDCHWITLKPGLDERFGRAPTQAN
jgi:hypothetical protein